MRATEHGHCKRTSIYRYLFRCLGLKNIFINYYDSKKVDYGFCYDSVHVTATAGTEYMEKHIGEVFEARVVSCNPYGLVVVLNNNIKGYVAFKDILDGFYIYGDQSHQLINKNDRSKNYRIGDKIYVMVKEASRETRIVNFYSSKEFIREKPKTRKMYRQYKDS